jgi:aspartate kinase
MNPNDEGTLITHDSPVQSVKAVAAKDGITAIRIVSSNMLLAYGFLRKVFEVFEKWKTPIDMIATSEVSVSLTIDDTTNLEQIMEELRKYGTMEVDQDMTIICLVGDFTSNQSANIAKVMNAMAGVPIRMISYGGIDHNVSFLVKSSEKVNALTLLNNNLLNVQ